MTHYMVFDVESIGLHGEGFAVAYVVVDESGKRHDCGYATCPPQAAEGSAEDREWVAQNVPRLVADFMRPIDVRNAFWRKWMRWKEQGAVLVTDCGWPVEARFLAACMDDDPSRKWDGPYPLHDLASIMLAFGKDPLATYERKADEKPEHHPLADAMQSARLLVEVLTENAANAKAPNPKDKPGA